MQEIDTWSAAGWRDPDAFAHYVHAKSIMKKAMDAAHARGMLLRPVTNGVLRLAQMSESILENRLAVALPVGPPAARKALERSQQRDALALLVRRLVKRSMKVTAVESQEVDGLQAPPSAATVAMYETGVSSSICQRTIGRFDMLARAQQEVAAANGAPLTWLNAPYEKARVTNRHGPVAGLNDHEHEIGISANYLESLLLPGHALRRDINAIMAFSASSNGQDFVPVGIFVYGTCKSTTVSDRLNPPVAPGQPLPPFHSRRYFDDYINFMPKRAADLNGGPVENPHLFRGNLPIPAGPPEAVASARAANAANQNSLQEHAVYYQQYNNPNVRPSELQHRVYDNRVAEVFVCCSQDPTEGEYDRRREAAIAALPAGATAAQRQAAIAQIAKIPPRKGWASLLMAFSLSFIATERISLGERGARRWAPKYAGVVMELVPDSEIVAEAPAASKSDATRGTQALRNIASRMGFSSQPVMKTPASLVIQQPPAPPINIPNFAAAPGGFQNRSYDDYVSLFTPGRDYFSLTPVSNALPSDILAENNAVLGKALSRGANIGVCPSTRGLGITKC